MFSCWMNRQETGSCNNIVLSECQTCHQVRPVSRMVQPPGPGGGAAAISCCIRGLSPNICCRSGPIAAPCKHYIGVKLRQKDRQSKMFIQIDIDPISHPPTCCCLSNGGYTRPGGEPLPGSTPGSEVEVGEASLASCLASWATGAASSLVRAVMVREGGTLRGSRSSSGINEINI